MSKQENQPDPEHEPISNTETIPLRRSGSSDVLTVPKAWLKAIPQLKGPLLFDATVQKDTHGNITIVFEKVKQNQNGGANQK